MNDSLESVEKAAGARMGHHFGRDLPAGFAGVEPECAAVRNRCGLFDARFRGAVRVTGPDRVEFLQGMLSNDLRGLDPGAGVYAAFLTAQGRVVSDLRAYVLADEIWLDVPAQRESALRAGLEQFLVADDVELGGGTYLPLVSVEGPDAMHTLGSALAQEIPSLAMFAHFPLQVDGAPVRIARVSHTGEDGYLLWGPAAAGPDLWARCRAAGAEPVGTDALEVLRVEAGIAWCDRDMDESVLAPEVGLEGAINFRKGCYVGQEVVERVAARGQVQRRMVGLICEGEEAPPAGSKLRCGGDEVGHVTSAVRSATLGSVIALGYARRTAWEPGTEVEIGLATRSVPARIVALPFYRAAAFGAGRPG